MTRRALIVDDERPARSELRRLLEGHEEIHVVGEAASIAEARRVVEKEDVDLVFLDIQLRAESGFALLSHLPDHIDVIFVTAFDQHAVRAFEVEATDYLLKPIVPERLAATVSRLASGHDDWRRRGLQVPPDHLRLRSGRRDLVVPIEEIVAVTAARDYTCVRLVDGSAHLVHWPMHRWETQLPGEMFARIHRSAIVNTTRIVGIERGPGRRMTVTLEHLEDVLPVSRRLQSRLRFSTS